MKKLLTLMIAAAAMISFTACEKENNEKVLPNEFTIGTDTHALGGAICYCYVGDDPTMTVYDIYLTDKVHWDANGVWEEGATNYSNSFETNVYNLYAKGVAEGSMPTGKFTYSLNEEHLTHDGASDYLVYDENGNNYDDYIEYGQINVESSKLEIEIKHISKNIYELKLTGGVDDFGNAVSGYYKGAFDIHVYHETDGK